MLYAITSIGIMKNFSIKKIENVSNEVIRRIVANGVTRRISTTIKIAGGARNSKEDKKALVKKYFTP